MATAVKPLEDEMFAGYVDNLIKGLFNALETWCADNAKTAGFCLVNISARPSGLIKVMEFINSDVRPDDQVIFFSIRNLSCTIRFNCLLGLLLFRE